MIEILFMSSLFLIFQSYLGYPLSLFLLRLFKKHPVKRKIVFPFVTIIITAYNEDKRIKKKIENTLEILYPKEKLQIIIASDGSTDKTNEIVESYLSSEIELLAIPIRGGKENAQKEAIKIAKGDIIVFTDVSTILESFGLEKIVSNFFDPTVGCVSSEDRLVGRDGVPSGEGLYVRYEMWLRRLESETNSLVGLSGSFFAARKNVCFDFSGIMQSDFRTLLNSVKIGLRGVIDPEAIGYYHDVSDPKSEIERKIRTVLRGLTVFFKHKEFLNPFKYGLFTYQYICHKLIRWLVPFFLFIVFICSMFLAMKKNIYFMLFVAQLLFYVIALLGWKNEYFYSFSIIRIATYFLIVNMSIVLAWWRYLRNERIIMWNPSER